MIQSWDDPPLTRLRRPWMTWAGLAALWALTFTQQYWMWSALFLGWAAYDIFTGESSFVQRVTRRANPVTYWLIVTSWVALSSLWWLYPYGW